MRDSGKYRRGRRSPTSDSTPRSAPRHLAGATALALLLACAPALEADAQDQTQEPGASAIAALPFAEGFDSAESLRGWDTDVGAQIDADGPASVVDWDDGAVRLRATPESGQWLALTRSIATGGADWILVEARMRWSDIDPSAAAFRNANLFVRVGPDLTPLRVAEGDGDWVTVRRRLPVPGPHSSFTLGVFLSMPGTLWVDDVSVSASTEPEWRLLTGERYRYHVPPGLVLMPEAIAFNDAAFAELSARMEVELTEPVDYFYYGDRARMEELTGFVGNARREGRTIHSVFPTDRHEIVHVLADAWGDPPALLGEGLAVSLSGGWQGRPLATIAAELVAAGEWVPLADLFSSRAFRALPDAVTYAQSGAFVAWLEQRFGLVRVRAAYAALDNGASDEANDAALRQSVGYDLGELEAMMLEDVRAGRFAAD